MKMRSWLFVPGDSERKLAKVAAVGADVVVIDLEDAVADHGKIPARKLATQWLSSHRQQVTAGNGFQRWVRINQLDGHHWREDLATVMAGQPDGIIIPKAIGPDQLRMFSAELYEVEQRNGITPNTTRIMPMVGETAKTALTISAYASEELPRLGGMTWGSEDLANALGASRKRDAAGQWTDVFRMVRAQVLLCARASGVAPVDTLHSSFRDLDGLKAAAEASFADGFAGMLAIHPDQVAVINAAFSPGKEQVAEAQAIVHLFAANPGAAALSLEGRMVEQPHLMQARRVLESAL